MDFQVFMILLENREIKRDGRRMFRKKLYTLHKPNKHKFKTRRILVSNVDDQWQADLVAEISRRSRRSSS